MVKNRKNKFRAIIIFFAVIVFIIGSAAYLAFWNKVPSTSENQSFSLIDKLRTLQVNGGTLELSQDEINSTFTTLFNKPIEKSGVTINGAFVNIGTNTMTLFAPVKYKGINLLPNVTGSISYENDRLIYKITSVKIGKLGIPKSILLNKLKDYSNEDVTIDADKIEISKFLLPFNAENIYLSDHKVIADIAKITAPPNTSIGESNGNTSSKGVQTSGTASNNSTNKVNTKTGNNQTNNSSPSTQTPSPVSETASKVASLNKISSQLNSVIADVETDMEKQMIREIQTVVKEVAVNPNYPYQTQANEVKAWYSSLQPEEKSRVRNAIISNVNVMDILKLINIFGM